MFPSSGIFVSPCNVFEAVNRLFRLLIKSEIFRYFLQLCTAKNRWAIASSFPFSINISPLDVNYVDISRHHLHWVTTSWLWRISHRDLSQSQTEEYFEWIIKVRKSTLFNRWEKNILTLAWSASSSSFEDFSSSNSESLLPCKDCSFVYCWTKTNKIKKWMLWTQELSHK